MRMLLEIADALGVDVNTADPGPGVLGLYLPRPRAILLRPGMPERQARCVLAHELGHAEHDDEHTGWAWADARQERRADAYAARLLIRADDVARAERMYGPNWPKIAYELGVTEELLAVWRGMERVER